MPQHCCTAKSFTRWGSFNAHLLRGAAESGALKANALPGGARRLAVRPLKAARSAFIEAKRRALTGQAGGLGAGWSTKGREQYQILSEWYSAAHRSSRIDRPADMVVRSL
jgi:hypothetical protein